MNKSCCVVLVALLFGACNYRADRYDEYVLTRQSDHFNLYKNVQFEILKNLNRPESANPTGPEGAETLFSGGSGPLGAGANAFSSVAIRFGRNPPLVEAYRTLCGKKTDKLLFSVPLVQSNSLLLRKEKNGTGVFQVLLSLRYDTLFPIVCKNNYELFILTIAHDAKPDEWTIREFKNVTCSQADAFQGVFNANGDSIAYVEDDREKPPRLIVMKRDGTDRKIVAENGLLPCFLRSGELLFVGNAGMFREFRIYSPADGETRTAADSEIRQLLRTMPHSALREFYLRLEPKSPEDGLFEPVTFRQIFEYGLRNSPLVLRGYYEYLAVKARNTQNLFDLGPDFFMGADYLLTSSILFDTPEDPYYVIGDRIGNDNFIRFLTGFSIPVLPNLPLRWAQRYHDDWKERYGRATVLKSVNEYAGRLARLAFDYWEASEDLSHISQQLATNRKPIQRFENQLRAGLGIAERLMFAQNIRASLQSERNAAAERLIRCQSDMAALVGMNAEKGFALKARIPESDDEEAIHRRHGVDWFLAQAQVNRQELRQLDALIQQDAATRDMGPERTRIDAVRVRISYGIGFIDWRRLVDDFLLMGVGYAVPLRLPKFFESYYNDYENRILALRMSKYQLIGAIRAEILSGWADYSTESGRYGHRLQRLDTVREQARRAGLLQNFGSRDMMTPAMDRDEYAAEIETLEEHRTGNFSRFERFRRLSLLYQAAGRSDDFLKQVFFAPPAETARAAAERAVKTTGVYLWTAPEIVCSKPLRTAFFEQCRSVGINLVYCYFSMKQDRIPFLVQYEPEYAYFIEECRRRGIRVFALIGEPAWIDPAQRGDMRTLLAAWTQFNRARKAAGDVTFDGLSLDVEPHSEPGWNGPERATLIAGYLSMLAEVNTCVPREKLNLAVPPAYSGVAVPGRDGDLLNRLARHAAPVQNRTPPRSSGSTSSESAVNRTNPIPIPAHARSQRPKCARRFSQYRRSTSGVRCSSSAVPVSTS